MKKKTKYTDEPMDTGRVVKDFLPRPKDLVFRKERVVTLLDLEPMFSDAEHVTIASFGESAVEAGA